MTVGGGEVVRSVVRRRADSLRCAPVELCGLITRVVDQVAGAARDRVVIDAARRVVANVDDGRVEHVLTNLVVNALRHAPPTTCVLVTLTSLGGRVRISVADAGSRVRTQELAQLSACRRIIEAHGGHIASESMRHVGTRFWFELPT